METGTATMVESGWIPAPEVAWSFDRKKWALFVVVNFMVHFLFFFTIGVFMGDGDTCMTAFISLPFLVAAYPLIDQQPTWAARAMGIYLAMLFCILTVSFAICLGIASTAIHSSAPVAETIRTLFMVRLFGIIFGHMVGLPCLLPALLVNRALRDRMFSRETSPY